MRSMWRERFKIPVCIRGTDDDFLLCDCSCLSYFPLRFGRHFKYIFKVASDGDGPQLSQRSNAWPRRRIGHADSGGNLYATDGSFHIIKIAAPCNVSNFVSTGLNDPDGITFDSEVEPVCQQSWERHNQYKSLPLP